MIGAVCDKCEEVLLVPSHLAGKHDTCPSCASPVAIPKGACLPGMKLIVGGGNGGETLDSPNDEIIQRVLRGFQTNPHNPYAILEAPGDGYHFLQTACSRGMGSYDVEYLTGPNDFIHFVKNVSFGTVILLFQSYARGDTSWLNAASWEQSDQQPPPQPDPECPGCGENSWYLLSVSPNRDLATYQCNWCRRKATVKRR